VEHRKSLEKKTFGIALPNTTNLGDRSWGQKPISRARRAQRNWSPDSRLGQVVGGEGETQHDEEDREEEEDEPEEDDERRFAGLALLLDHVKMT
jgi:hypothetical protein